MPTGIRKPTPEQRTAQLNRLWDKVAHDPALTHADHDAIRAQVTAELKPNTPDAAAFKVVRKVITKYLTKGQDNGR